MATRDAPGARGSGTPPGKIPSAHRLFGSPTRRLDEFASQPRVSAVSDRSSISSLSSGVLGRDQAEKGSQLAHVSQLTPIADPSQKLTGHNLANPVHAHHVLYTLGQFGIVLTQTADLLSSLNDLLLVELQTVKQLI